MRLKFTQDLLINVKSIDEQHKELFVRINDLVSMGHRSVSKEETDKTIHFLATYVVKHFEDEEALQRKSGYPKYEEHAKHHKDFMSDFQKLKAEYEENGVSTQFTLKLNNTVINWIVKHIRTADAELGRYLNKQSK